MQPCQTSHRCESWQRSRRRSRGCRYRNNGRFPPSATINAPYQTNHFDALTTPITATFIQDAPGAPGARTRSAHLRLLQHPHQAGHLFPLGRRQQPCRHQTAPRSRREQHAHRLAEGSVEATVHSESTHKFRISSGARTRCLPETARISETTRAELGAASRLVETV